MSRVAAGVPAATALIRGVSEAGFAPPAHVADRPTHDRWSIHVDVPGRRTGTVSKYGEGLIAPPNHTTNSVVTVVLY